MPRPRPFVDAHLDLAWNALYFGRDLLQPLEEVRAAEAHMTDVPWRGRAMVCLPEMRRAHMLFCVATVIARAGPNHKRQATQSRHDLDYPFPAAAYAHAQGQLSYYRWLDEQGTVRILRFARDLDQHVTRWKQCPEEAPIGMILSMEGCDPIIDPSHAAAWYRDGLRAAGLTHYGYGRYAGGSGTDGPLTPEGVRLLAEFERLGIALDVTHLSDRSMEQALDLFGGPTLASHHNCRALVPGFRQLADQQIRRLIARNAVIGLAMDAWMLYPGWQHGVTSNCVVGLEAAADQIDHLCQLAGNADHAALGTDLDGGFGSEQTPFDLRRMRDVRKLIGMLEARGYTPRDVDAIFFGNWLRFFRSVLPPAPP